MTDNEQQALASLLERPALERLWAAAQAKLERYGALRGSACVDDPSAAERRAVADLLGRRTLPPADRPLRIRLLELDRTLRDSRFAIGLEDALARHRGALRNLPAERAAEDDRWQRFWQAARSHYLIRDHADIAQCLADIESTGLYRRLAEKGSEPIETLLERVLAVLREVLDGADGVRLAVLANRTLGDSHALDPGHRVPALVLRALARIHGQEIPTTAAARRDLWARVGVVCDDLSCDVLVLGLAPTGDGLLHRFLRQHAAVGEPLRITLRQLARAAAIRLTAPGPVFVCENPAVVSVAADQLGPESPPLVCLAGQPDTAARVLLESLASGGAELRYHGDFDWGGLRIANALSRMVPVTPWRFTAEDYLRVVGVAGGAPLGDQGVDAEWDPGLRPAMEAKGLVVEEEAVIDDLMADLGS